MPAAIQQFRLAHLPRAPRVLVTCFVLLLGIGYLVAVLNVYLTYAGADGKPGMTARDLQVRLHGDPGKTLLASVIAPGGKMAQYLPEAGDRETVLEWVREGAPEAGFVRVQPVLARSCAGCHSVGGAASFRPLTTYPQVRAVARAGGGESMATWARVAHAHIQGLALLYLCLGLLFSFCAFPERLKLLVVSLPFVALVADFGTRALAHTYPVMVHGVMASGALIGLATGVMIATVLFELWIRRPPALAREGGPAA